MKNKTEDKVVYFEESISKDTEDVNDDKVGTGEDILMDDIENGLNLLEETMLKLVDDNHKARVQGFALGVGSAVGAYVIGCVGAALLNRYIK